MSTESRIAPTIMALLLVILVVVRSSDAAQRHTFILNGKSTEVPVIYVNSQPYVGLEALAKALNGSINSSGAKVALSLPTRPVNHTPPATEASATPVPTEAAPSSSGFSREFLSAGIEARRYAVKP